MADEHAGRRMTHELRVMQIQGGGTIVNVA
jgi:hypothetical protein